jgi:hypothetical protein
VVAFRYRSLVPFMYVLLMLETLLRELVGHLKPVVFAHRPPGAIGDYVVLPLAAVMLVLSLWKAGARTPEAAEKPRDFGL